MSNGHKCKNTNGGKWYHCSACAGRVHNPECSTRRDRNRDCCKARHEMLHAQGQTVGLGDESIPMIGSHA